MDAEYLQALKENTAAVQELVGLMKAKETRSDWLDYEGAATILGLNITKGRVHRANLRWLIQKGFIKQFRPGRPYRFYRNELEKVAKKIANGEIGHIGRA